ncbi:MAG: DUF1800 domain-containing protein [Fimbriimonadaceae bacterium]|nr:DUF1800 domain-containing protein [Fimbriimonadaceae bacterium]
MHALKMACGHERVNKPQPATSTAAMASQQDRIIHLLNRFGLGASAEDLAYYGAGSWEDAIEKLLNDDRPEVDVKIAESFFDPGNPGLQRMSQLQGHWYRRLIITNRPLQHRMLLFWHDHFATGSSKVRIAQAMLSHMDTLYENGLGSFRSLLGAVAMDPAMIIWLDLQENTKDSPNENFARELMELFTLGIDNGYTESDVREVARAFTGWQYRQSRRRGNRTIGFAMDRDLHDDGPKTILGQTGNFDGNDVMDILCRNPETARFIARKAWEYFAYKGVDPETLDRITKPFVESGLEIRSLIQAIATDEQFYSPKAVGTKVKSPVDFCVGSARAIGVQKLERADASRPVPFGSLLKVATRDMGMTLLEPPDVNGWPSGQDWISSATMMKRIAWARLLFMGEQQALTRNRRRAPPFTAREFFKATTPAELALELINVLGATTTPEQTATVVSAAEAAAGGPLTTQNFNAVASQAATVLFALPRFHMN